MHQETLPLLMCSETLMKCMYWNTNGRWVVRMSVFFGTHACKVQVFWFVVAMLASSQVIQAFLYEYYFRWSFIKLLQEMVFLLRCMHGTYPCIYEAKFFTFMNTGRFWATKKHCIWMLEKGALSQDSNLLKSWKFILFQNSNSTISIIFMNY